MPRKKHYILLALFIISLIASLILSLGESSGVCPVGEGCDIVQSSIYSYTFEIKNSHYGVVIFSILSILTLLQIKELGKKIEKAILYSIIAGSIIAIYFLYLQRFIIQSYCPYCLIVDFSLLAALITIIYYEKIK